jgi:hypothetical protein
MSRPAGASVRRHAAASDQPAGALGPLALPLAFAVGLSAFALIPAAQTNPRLFWSILGASGALLLGLGALWLRSRGRSLAVDVQLRPQHYLQACAQTTVLLYWGWYWQPVYDALPLLAAQLVFAYAFDMLLAWSRRDSYTLGFGPFPVIFSINLFLWFKPDWFYLQFLMIAVGFAAKDLIRWEKDGRRSHIFNPSSFPLALFSIGLIATGSTSMTYGPEIASTQFNPPNIYLLLFLVGLPGQYLFGVTTMTMSAVLTTYLLGQLYFWTTGSYFFIDSYIPIAVFLGMHLLFTDPSTSPRTELGRVIFGVMYGVGNMVLYEVLGWMDVPSFYDKLLPVPIMNLSIRAIDRAVRSTWLQRYDPARIAPNLSGRPRHLAYMTVWAIAFVLLSVTDGVGDHHPGHRVPFWQQACQQGARGACDKLAVILDTYCRDGSGWACNEVGALRFHGRTAPNPRGPFADFQLACDRGLLIGCQNVAAMKDPLAGAPRQLRPTLRDYPIILRTGKGPLPDQSPMALETEACDQGFFTGCEDAGGRWLQGDGVPRDPLRAASLFELACTANLATSCSNLGLMHYSGDGIPKDTAKGLEYLKRSCELGFTRGCRWLEDEKARSATLPPS